MCSRRICGPAFLYAFLQLLWALLLLGLAIAKIAAYGAEEFLLHFTNWSWLLQGVFYITTIAFVVPASVYGCCNVSCTGHIVALCFLPLNAIVWYVAVAVFVLLITDPEFITDLFDAIDPGVVIVGNDVFHTIPVLAIVFYGAIQHHLIWYGLNKWFVPIQSIKDGPTRCCALFWLIVYETVGGALLYAGLYFFVLAVVFGTSVSEVYGTDIPTGAGIGLFIFVALVFSGVPLLVMACCYRLFERPKFPTLAERRVYESIDDVHLDDDVLAFLEARNAQPATSTRKRAMIKNIKF